jgi:hypothetical protein
MRAVESAAPSRALSADKDKGAGGPMGQRVEMITPTTSA